MREYIEGKVYEDGVLKKILFNNGYYDFENGIYYFYLRDHLGNNSVVARGSDGAIMQGQHYYPYGKVNEYEGAGSPSFQPYKFGGKEHEPMFGLNLLDFHARQYDPVLGRPLTIDPLAEKYYSWSPYSWCAGNPVRFTDPTGKWVVGRDGNPVTYSSEKGWSKNASKDVIRIGNEMVKTNTGMTQLTGMINDEAAINISISKDVVKEGEKYELGNFVPTDAYITQEGNVIAKQLDIVINEGSVKEYIKSKGAEPSKSIVNAVIGATAVHESGHTDRENIKQVRENKAQGTNHDVEKMPNELMDKHIEELKNNQK
jgi:RHS repeat-associated protein